MQTGWKSQRGGSSDFCLGVKTFQTKLPVGSPILGSKCYVCECVCVCVFVFLGGKEPIKLFKHLVFGSVGGFKTSLLQYV